MRSRLSTIWTVAHRDLTTRGRSKAFRVSTVVLLIGLIVGIVVPSAAAGDTGGYTVVVAGASDGRLAAAISTQANARAVAVETRAAADRDSAVTLVESGTADAAVVALGGDPELIWDNADEPRLAQILTAALGQLTIDRRAQALGLTPGQVSALFAPAEPVVTRLHPAPDRTPQTVIAMIGMILLFAAINIYGSYVLTGVVEEKSSRVVEVLLARVRPADLLAGKVLGIGLLGIAQFAALAVTAAVTLQIARPPHLPAGTVPLIGGVVLWFILGYSFYSVLYGALGALAARIEDAQVAAAPITGFLLLVYFGALTAISNPSAWWITAASLIPPTAPIYMPLRAALTDVPTWQMVAAVLGTAAAILGVVRVGGRLYRGAVLHTAGRLRIRQAWHGTW